MVIPADVIVSNLELPYEYIAILQTTLALYIVYLIVTLLIKKQNTKSLVATIGISLAILTIISFVSYFIYCKCFNNYLNKSLNNQVKRKNR